MSHFTVLVTGEDIFEQMNPYNEDVCREEFEHVLFDEILPQSAGHLSKKEVIKWVGKTLREDNESILFLPQDSVGYTDFKNLYFEHSVRLFVYYDKSGRLMAVKRLVHESGHWDWFMIGGRWHGSLLAKEGHTEIPILHPDYDIVALAGGAHSKYYRDNVENPVFEGGVNQLLLKDIDFDAMRKIRIENEIKFRDRFKKAIGSNVYTKFSENWELDKHVKEREKIALIEDDEQRFTALQKHREVVRNDYNDLPAVKALAKEFKDSWNLGNYDTDWDNRMMIIEKTRIRTYAQITLDGKWEAHGKMGWFGMSDDKMEESAWVDHQNAMLDSLPGETLISIIDAHV